MTKLSTEKFMERLINEHGYEEFVGVPCSYLKPIINYAVNRGMYTKATNEGDAVAYAVGQALAGRKVVVLIQNSGLSNAYSPITSLVHTFKVPVLMIIGYRGVGGKDEPQHLLMGEITKPMLNAAEFLTYDFVDDISDFLDESEDLDITDIALESLIDNPDLSHAFLVRKDSFESVKLETEDDRSDATITRDDVLETVVEVAKEFEDKGHKVAIIATTGFTGRALYALGHNPRNFYMVGSMGCALAIGTGIAKAQPDTAVVVVDGDAALMMRPSTMYLTKEVAPKNLVHLLVDNGANESTGGQYTIANEVDITKDMHTIYGNADLTKPITEAEELKLVVYTMIMNALSKETLPYHSVNAAGIYTVTKNKNDDLPRPKESVVDLSKDFAQYLQG